MQHTTDGVFVLNSTKTKVHTQTQAQYVCVCVFVLLHALCLANTVGTLDDQLFCVVCVRKGCT